MREYAEQRAALGHDVAPARRLGRDADAQEAQDRLGQDRGGGGEGRLHDQRRDCVGHDVPEQENPGRRADGDGALDIGLLAHGEHDRADETHHARHVRDDDGEDHGDQARAPDRHQGDGEQYARNGHQPVHDAHDDAVGPAHVARNQADDQADADGEEGDADADHQRHARAVEHAAVDVAAEAVGAHDHGALDGGAVVHPDGDLGAGNLVARRGIDAGRIDRAQHRGQDGDRHHDQQDHAAEDDRRVAEGQLPQRRPFGRRRRNRRGIDDFVRNYRAQ